jgi:hypothetical protein
MPYPGEVILVREPGTKVISNTATFDVVVDSLTHDLAAYCTSYETMLRSSEVFQDLEIITKEHITFQGVPAIEYHCSATAAHLPIEWKSVVLSHRGRMLKLSTASVIGFFEVKKEMTDRIFSSFRLQ